MPDDTTDKIAEQARAFLAWAEQEMRDGVFLRGALQELKKRIARLLYALPQRAAGSPGHGGDAAAQLWAFFSAVDPRKQSVGHRLFIESFSGGEPTDRTLDNLSRADYLSVGPPRRTDSVSWKAAVEHGFAGRAAVAELLQAVRGIALQCESGAGSATKLSVERPRASAALMRSIMESQLAPGGDGPPPKPTHSPDFTSVNWFGTPYAFAKGNQAESVRVLWAAWEDGGHSLSQETIGDRINSNASRFELAKVFRRRKPGGSYKPHPALGTMIQQASKGSYHLAPPESA